MNIDARAKFQREIHAHPARRLNLGAVIAHILQPGVRVLGHVLGQRRYRPDIPARGRNRHGNAIQRVAGNIEIVAFDDDFVTRRLLAQDFLWRDGIGNRLGPAFLHILDGTAHTQRIDRAIGRQHADSNRHIKLMPLESTTLVNRKALRSFSSMPPRNCQRTSGCISVSLLISRSTVTSSPASSSAFR